MLNHISIGVRDIARTKRFYDAALKPLGYTALSEGETSLGYGKDTVVLWISATDKPVPADDRNPACISASMRRPARASRRSMRRALAPAARTTASPACAPTTGRTTTRPSWSIRTATGSKPIAARRPKWPRSASK